MSAAATKSAPAAPERVLRADARRNREAVLAAARERFADEGTEAQIDDIARDAGVGVGTVYRHFPTKEALTDALVAVRFERIAEEAAKALERAEEEPWEAFRDYMYFSVELQAGDRALSQMMASRPETMHAHAVGSGAFELMSKLVERTKEAGHLREDFVPEDVPMIICGLGRVIEAGALPKAANWKRFLGIAIDGVRAPGNEPLPPLAS